MVSFLFYTENILFTSAIILMIFISLLEGLLVVLGMGLSDALDNLIPDFELEMQLDTDYSLSKFFGWIRLKRVPFLMLLVIFLASFGLSGLILQYISYKLTGSLFFAFIIVIPAFIFSLFSLRVIGGIVAKILPKDETSSISKQELIGYVATITLGKAKKGSPAEAKIKDKYGQTHYFMVEPENEDDIFNQGDRVLISNQNQKVFFAIKDLPEKLKD